jgi:hypothetical protein
VRIDPGLGVLAWPTGADLDAELLRCDDLWGPEMAERPWLPD